jgi:hypothetical protein
VTFEGTFNGSLPLFDPSIAQGYQGDIQSFQLDLTNVARYFVNYLVKRNTADYKQQLNYLLPNNNNPLQWNSGGGGAIDGTFSGNINSFGTNNQETNVDEADLVKSDGTTGTLSTGCANAVATMHPNAHTSILTLFYSICGIGRLHCHGGCADRC